MAEMQQYKCPCCGGKVEFDTKSQGLKCPYCDSEFEIESVAEYDKILENQTDDEIEWEKGQTSEIQVGEGCELSAYSCTSCGGEIIGDKTLAATSCPYCGNPVVLMDKFKGMLKPDYVIPFKLDKKYAKQALNNYYKGKLLLPKAFKTQNHIDEIKGIYVPFWLFDADIEASIRYKATRKSFWSDSKYDYVKTSYYSVQRDGTIGFEKVPVDGSKKMPDELMESIEPYNYSEAVDFQTAYLAGYFADKYDVSSDESIQRANQRIKVSTEQMFASTVVGYSSVSTEHSSIKLRHGSTKYALLPVWILNTTWKDKKYTFAMNGQTGKMVGNMPMDGGLFAKWLLGLTAACSLLAYGIMLLASL